MHRFHFLLPAACLGFALSAPVSAQAPAAAASAASAAASVPESKPARKPLSTEALRDSGTFPDDLQPQAAKPQIKVPLGRKPPVSAAAASAVQGDGARAPKVNDGVARCKAQAATPAAREACLRALP